MDPKNLKYLQDTLKYHGFGDKLFAELESNMKAVNKEFTLSVSTEMNKDKVNGTLHFRKSNDGDNYFFNKFDAKLEKTGMEPREQTFYLDKGKGFTMKEAYNYLDGRAVHKEFTNQEGEKYKAWRQIDPDYKDKNNNFEFKQYSERYGYDLREALSYYPIREFVKADDSLNLVKALERGNLQPVTMDRDGEKLQLQISADPKNRTLNIYEMDGRLLSKTEREELMLAPEIREQRVEQRNQLQQDAKVAEGQFAGKEQAKEAKGEEKTAEKGNEKTEEKNTGKDKAEEKTKGKGKDLLGKGKNDKGLLEKKRTGNKKGLGV